MAAVSPWTEDRIKLLLELRDEGLSSRQIGNRLEVTRNAVIGKLARMGEKFGAHYDRSRHRHRIRKAAPKPKPPKKPKISFNYDFTHTPDELKSPGTFPQEPTSPLNMPAARACGTQALHALQPRDCRWPIGDPRDPEFRFCGARCGRGEIYCSHHRVASVSRDQRIRSR